MDERLTVQLKLFDKYIAYLEMLSQKPREVFFADVTVRGASERYLQLAIETSLNIGVRIIALEADKIGIDAPENYADIFIKLGKLGVFSEDFVLRIVNMARFRNKLVHAYWEIDAEKVYEILQQNLSDLHEFREGIIAYLDNRSPNS